MIIGIDASRANRQHKSGTEWYAFYLIKHLAKIDPDNQYILYTDYPLSDGLDDLTSDSFQSKQNIPKFDSNGYQIITSHHNNFKAKVLNWPFKFFWTLGRLSLEMITHKPDVLFVPAHTLPLIHPKKSVVTIHDIGFKRQTKLYTKDKLGYKSKILHTLVTLFTLGRHRPTQIDYLDWSTKFALNHAQKIITISNFSKAELIDVYKANPSQITVVYNGYNDNIYKQLSSEKTEITLARNGITRPYIFYVGRLEKKKNISNLIEAFALLKQNHPEIHHKLILVGNASYGFDEIKYNISEYNLDHEVIMTGWINELYMPDIFNGADAFVFPSNYEGFGIPLLQAMACGTPIIASDISPVREVTDGAALLFNPDQTADIADKIFKLVTSPGLQKDLSVKGLTRVKNFNWEKCAQETLKVIISK